MSPQKTCPQCGSEYELDVMFCPKDGTTLRVPVGGGLVGSVLADRYHILRKLGEGGMGQVYLAEHVKMGRKSAIKVMNPSMSQDPEAIGRFNREASNASRISHNNVCGIYDFGETPDGLIYLAMEYVEGESLTKVMEREGALAPERAADITRQVANALDAAHDIGIVHRDLKPDNIMVAKNRDGSDLVKVVDFGIAKAAHGDGQKVTRTGLVVGTPEYMSPEQLSGDQLDGRSDTYTLGLVTFHMLTGVLPFPSTTIQESMIMRLTDRPRTLAEMRPDVSWPPPVQAVLDRVLQRRAEDRYQRAGEFAAEMERAVHGMPASATRVGTQVVGSTVPPTAAHGAAASATTGSGTTGSAAAPAGAAMPATAASAPVAVPRKRGVLVPVGAAAGLVVIGVTAWMVYGQQRSRGGDLTAASGAHVVAMADSTTPQAGGSSGATGRETSTTDTSAPRDAEPSRPVEKYAKQERPASGASTDSAKTVAAKRAVPNPERSAPTPASAPPVSNASAMQPAPTSTAPPPASVAPAADEFDGDLTAERARQGVQVAATLLERQETERALRILGRALKRLPTLDDSITALYHVSEGLFQRAERTGSSTPKQRACTILNGLKAARGHKYATSIAYLYDQECK
ncbi:MAG TPA: protein kinase [Gemmatimonadaceae bacterium]|nr:protein kinase [Gemmatimonadaceae bacterium]